MVLTTTQTREDGRAMGFIQRYIRDAEGRELVIDEERNLKKRALSLLLKFWTGYSYFPAAGLSMQLKVEFSASPGALPTASTCMCTLVLPSALTAYPDFKEKMDKALSQCATAVFGMI